MVPRVGSRGLAFSPASSIFIEDAPDTAAFLLLCAGHSSAGPGLSNSLRFWPQLGLHAFRTISLPPFTWGFSAGTPLPFCTRSSLHGHEEMGGSSGGNNSAARSGLNLGKTGRVCISLKMIRRRFCFSQRVGDDSK